MVMDKKKKIICKYNCGYIFDNTPVGQAALMRHYRWECPKNPEKRQMAEERINKIKELKPEDERLDISEVLEKILRETSQNRKIPAVMRMVEPYIDDPKKSLERLSEAMRLADFRPTEMKLVLWNWATFLHIDPSEVIKEEKTEAICEEKKESKDIQEVIMHSTYSNIIKIIHRENEMILLFGQMPVSDSGALLTTRIYINKNFAKKIINSLFNSLAEEKEENYDNG